MQRSALVIIGIAVVVLAGIVAFLFLSGQGEPASDPSPTPRPAETRSPSPSPSFAADLLERRWTVLFVGTDLNERREEAGEPVNTDSLMLVSLSEDQSELTLISLPRDTVDVPLEDGTTYERKINALYADRGIDALRGAMEALFGVPIDAHVVLDMDDFTSLVDAVGEIEVNPDEPLTDDIVDLDLEPGPQEIDAVTANGYVRTRVDKDYGRMGRQQEVLVELVRQLTAPDAEVDLRRLLDSLESLETDLPLDHLPTLVELARRAGDADVTNVLVEPPLITFEGDRGDGRGYVLEADVEAIREEVTALIGRD